MAGDRLMTPDEVIGVAIQGVRFLSEEVDALQARIAELEAKLATPPPNVDDIADRLAARLEPALAANTRALRRASMRK